MSEQKIELDKRFLFSHINGDRLQKYFKQPDRLKFGSILKIAYWVVNKPLRVMYFYMLCENGLQNFQAFNLAYRDHISDIEKYIRENISKFQLEEHL